jgi:hypothetical protein
MDIYSNQNIFYIRFTSSAITSWKTGITIINDQDASGRLFGSEVFLYQDPQIIIESIEKQFANSEYISIYDGLMYIIFRKQELSKRGRGFGRSGVIGIDNEGLISIIFFPWHESGSANPIIDYKIALNGLEYKMPDSTLQLNV